MSTTQILVMSDTHGLTNPILQIVAQHPDVTSVIHCGDSELDQHNSVLNHINIVRGNCDFDSSFPNDILLDVHNTKIFVTHGHLYGVKSSLLWLIDVSKKVDADIVCYGHTHIAKTDYIEDCLFINPGSIAYPRGRKEATYAIITISDYLTPKIEFYNYSNHSPITLID